MKLRGFCANCVTRPPSVIRKRGDGVPVHLCSECSTLFSETGGHLIAPPTIADLQRNQHRALS